MDISTEPVLQVSCIAKAFGGVQALRNGSFSLYKGEVIAIVGANGAGKSTLIKIISGVHRPDSGSISVKGHLIPKMEHSVKKMRKMGVEVVYQDLALVPNMSAPYNLFLGRTPTRFKIFVDEKKMRDKTQEVLQMLNVTTVQSLSLPICSMSGGQQQSIAIGRAIAWGKDIIILDEPTAALGPNETEEVEHLIREAQKKGIAVILISHNLNQVMRLANRIIVTYHGITSKELEGAQVTLEQLIKAITVGE